MAHDTRNWLALETTDKAGSTYLLTVTGEFESRRSNEIATLKEAVPQGTNPAILILDLHVTAPGVGGDVVEWKPVEPFAKVTSEPTYQEVTIRHDGTETTIGLQTIPS